MSKKDKHNVEITDIELNDVQVLMNKGQFELIGYDELKNKVVQIADYLQGVDVTEDNIKENKKLVARVRKATDELNEGRIRFKKMYLEPYEYYAQQVKDITTIARDAEDTVRVQIRELEELEREQKKTEIRELFEKRLRPYEHKELMEFDDFFEQKFCNKTFSISKVEDELVAYLEQKEQDFLDLEELGSQLELPVEELVTKYMDGGSKSVAQVTLSVQQELNKKQEIKKKIEEIRPAKPVQRDYIIKFKDAENYSHGIHVLSKAGIDFDDLSFED